MNRLLLALAFVLAPTFAPTIVHAQSVPAFQTGTMLPHHIAKFFSNGLIGDASPNGAQGGDNFGEGVGPFLIDDHKSDALCWTTAKLSLTHHVACLGHNATSDAVLSVDGVAYLFPPAGNGNVLGPNTTVQDNLAAWNNTGGTALKDSGIAMAAVVSSGATTIVGQLPLWNNTTGTLLKTSTDYTLIHDGGINRDTFQGVQTVDTAWTAFGNAAMVMATHGNQNGIVGSVLNDLAPATVSFPTGVTGVAKLNGNGNVTFGVYGQCDAFTPGICLGAEVAGNNWSGVPDPSLPPNQGLGTTTNVVIPLHVGCGGNFDCPILLSLDANGAAPRRGVVGLYTWPAVIRDYGIYIDADGSNGPGIASAMLKNQGSGINLILKTAALQTPANKVLDVRASTDASSFSISQAGGFTLLHQVAPATPANTGEFVVYVDIADNKLKTKSYGGTVTTLALP